MKKENTEFDETIYKARMLSYNKSSINKQLSNLPQDLVEHRGAAIEVDLMGRCSKACPMHPSAPAILQEETELQKRQQEV